MKRASDWTRELATGVADLNVRRRLRAESAVDLLFSIVGMVAAVGLGVWWLLTLLTDCGGAAC